MEATMEARADKMVGGKIDARHQDMLDAILADSRRTFKAKLEMWIENDYAMLVGRREMKGA